MRVGFRVLTVVVIGGLLWVAWTAVSVWLSFRSIDRIEVDLEGAREAIESLSVQDRPPPPPLEPDPVETDPVVPPSTTAVDGDDGGDADDDHYACTSRATRH